MNTKKFKCYARHNVFKYEAPYNIVSASNKEDAIKQFGTMTRLADFQNEWTLIAFEITR